MIGERSFARLALAAGLCLLFGGAAALWGLIVARQAFFTAWLAAFYFWIGVPLGALALLLIHDLTGGRWERVARPPLEAAAATLPLFILLFLPIAADLPALYAWARPAEAATLTNRWYLNPAFFGARAGFYLVAWCGLAALKLGWPRAALPEWLAAIGVIVLGLTVSFAATDWIMSIEPHWFSTIYGMVAGAGQFIAALAFVLAVIVVAGPPAGVDEIGYRDDLANLATLLLAVVIFWAYASFCQYLIVWEENLSSEIGWYIERLRGGWQDLIYGVAVAQFLVPFVALVSTPGKRSRAVVGSVACLLAVADLGQTLWLVLPPFGSIGVLWLGAAVAIFMGAAWTLVFLLALRYGHALPFGAARAARLGHG